MRIYLDVCCLNRPFNDQTHDRIRLEAEAIILILSHIEAGEWQWLGSEAVNIEIAQTRDEERRTRVYLLASHATETVCIEAEEIARSQELQTIGFHALDALHIACAERGGVDIFLTTDDRLLRLAARSSEHPRVQVANPLAWLAKVAKE